MRYLDNKPETGNRLLGLQTIKQKNIKRVFDLVRCLENPTRALIAKQTKLTPTTVSSLVDELINFNYVKFVGIGTSSTGRKPIILEINPDGMQIPVISIKPNGMQYHLFDLALNPVESLFIPFPEELLPVFISGDGPVEYRNIDGSIYINMVEDIIRNKSELLNRSRVKALCLTIPGTFSLQDNNFSSSVLQVKTPADFVNKIKDCLDIPVLVGNESSSLAYAEKCHVGKSMDDLLFVNICSGVGAGIIINDKLFTGTGGLAGEIGHISINYGGRPCFCGNRGCLERYVNLNAIMDSILRELRNGTDSLLPKMCNNDYSKINFDMLRIANENGDSLVHNMLEIAASRLTLGISNMICALSCYSIVLGGGIEKLGPSFLYMVRHEIATSGFRKVMNKVSVRYATAQNDAECLGVAEYFIDNIFEIMDKARDEVGVV